jgi:hypothetical protein
MHTEKMPMFGERVRVRGEQRGASMNALVHRDGWPLSLALSPNTAI